MALDIFLKLGEIKGDSLDARHRDEIVVLSWDWAITQTAAPLGGGGASGAPPSAGRSSAAFVSRIASTSPRRSSCWPARPASVCARRSSPCAIPANTRAEFLTVKLSDVIVTLVEPAINGDNGETYEAVTFEYGKVEVEYTPRAPNGTPGTPVRFGWDLRANKSIP